MKYKIFTTIAITTILSASLLSTANATGDVWNSSTLLKGNVVIPVGKTITVAPNTKIAVDSGTKITVLGTLNAPAGLSLIGKSWTGLDIKGTANLSNLELTGATMPFFVDVPGVLTIKKGKVYNVSGASAVEGKLTATMLEYEKSVVNGINSNGNTGTLAFDKSTFTSSTKGNGDFFGLSGAKKITLTNSTISDAHCAFHVQGVTDMKLDKVTISANVYGFMMYGSSLAGSKTITNTTIKNNEFGIDEGSSKTRNGIIKISKTKITGNGKDLILYTGAIKINK